MAIKLTPREQEIYHELVTNPGTLVEIGKKLNLTTATMRCYMQNISYKLGVCSRIALIIQHYTEELNRRNKDG